MRAARPGDRVFLYDPNQAEGARVEGELLAFGPEYSLIHHVGALDMESHVIVLTSRLRRVFSAAEELAGVADDWREALEQINVALARAEESAPKGALSASAPDEIGEWVRVARELLRELLPLIQLLGELPPERRAAVEQVAAKLSRLVERFG